MSTHDLATTYLSFAVKRLQLSVRDIDACTSRLTEDQLWSRGGDHENSIGNLVLHLEGNMRQWILHGIAGQPDVRERDEEFTLTPAVPFSVANLSFHATVAEVVSVLSTLPAERLLEVIDPQPGGTWRHITIVEAVFQVIAHVQQHMGQIVLLTKQLTASDLDLSMPRKR